MHELSRKVRVASSDRTSLYEVTFIRRTEVLLVECSCPAGERKKICRHKLGLLEEDAKILFSAEEKSAFDEVREWLHATEYSRIIGALHEAEREVEATKKKVASIKRALETFMEEGCRIKVDC